MLYNHFTEKLIGLQHIEVEKIEKTENSIHIFCKLKRVLHKCPCCGNTTDKIHDYREQVIKDIPAFGKHLFIHLKKRRYCCSCGKRFAEKNDFLPRYHRMTNRLSAYIIDKLRSEVSFSSVAREVNLSVSTVIRVFDMVSYSPKKLPTALSIDEFKGNTGGEKYQCILTDPVNKIVLDILPKRKENYLTHYFNCFDKSERNKVNFFVSDMWKPYSNISSVWFKNATQIVDKYHWIRQVIWAFESVRKEEQKKFSKTHRRYFKKSRQLLLKRFNYLSDEQKQQVNIMLYASPILSNAHFYKEDFLNILDCKDRISAQKAMSHWINSASNCGIPQIQKCAKTMVNWLTGILNSFTSNITNGFTEGCNNKIKVLKRNAYGFTNFKRFRNRILHIFSHQNQKQVAT
ncbi:ISL3 family transposase [Oscillospiraceae bacterium LCP25S3_E4]